jgi:diguanylate cyclase (GGDEF)-like protein
MNLQGLPAKYPWLQWAVLVIGILASIVTYSISRHRSSTEAAAVFTVQASEIANDIEQRIRIYTDVLYALRGLFSASVDVDLQEFRRFARDLAVHERYPGLANVSYAFYVRGPDRQKFETQMRRTLGKEDPAFTSFTVHPADDREGYHVLTYIEPLAPNRVALGLDLANDPGRRVAVEKARDSGVVAVTPGIALLRDSNNRVVSVLMRLAVYRGGDVPDTVEARQRQYQGLVGVAIRVNEMMANTLTPRYAARFRIEVFEQIPSPSTSAATAAGDTLFESNELAGGARGTEPDRQLSRYAYITPITVGDRVWSVRITPRTDPGSLSGKLLPVAFALLILVLSVLLFTALKLLARADQFATHDKLTGLYNRHYMNEWFDMELTRAARGKYPVSAVLFDIDHFKKFNDTWGHQAGDHVLQQLAALLLRSARGSDVVCRYGGEEFLLLMPGVSTDTACQRAELLRKEVGAMPLYYSDRDLGTMTLSAGVATYPQHATDADALLLRADEALYQAKQQGRNRVMQATTMPSQAANPAGEGGAKADFHRNG